MSALYNSIERQLGAWQWPENHGRCIVLVVVVVVLSELLLLLLLMLMLMLLLPAA